jgi:arylsulfatase A-like enzyme
VTDPRAPAKIALALAAALAGCAAEPQRPDVILLVVDTLRADHLGSYGYPGPISPHADRLAAESVRFTACFAQAPWTKPSVASLLTSLYPQVHGMTDHEGQYWNAGTDALRTGILSENAVTLAEALRGAGYATGGFIANPWIVAEYGFAQGFDVYDQASAALGTPADDLTGRASAWLESLPRDRPAFLYVHFMDVHAPYALHATREDHEAIAGALRPRDDARIAPADAPHRRFQNIEVRPFWATNAMRETLSYWKARYGSGVRAFDRRLGAFLDELRAAGRLDRAWIVLTSDHGEELYEHGGWSHGQNLYDHQLRVPLLVRRPGGRGAGSVDDIVQLVDLMPTLLALAGARPEPAAQGRDLSPLLAGRTVEPAARAYATATQRVPGLYAVRERDAKLILDADTGDAWLYDLVRDPAEQRDRSAALGARVAELTEALWAHIRESTAGGTLDRNTISLPDDARERLKALGYLD